MKHRELAESFASGATSGRGSRMFIENGVIYSYGHHFPVAKKCIGYYLFNKSGYSSSTSKHKDCVRFALIGRTVIEVRDCNPAYAEKQIEENEKEIIELLHKDIRARKRDYMDEIKYLSEQNMLINKHLLNKEAKEETISEFIERKGETELLQKMVLKGL